MVGTFWAFVPAIIAIVLALLTKQVYLSLFAGIFVGAMFLAGGNPIEALSNMLITLGQKLGDNGGILIFLVVLGIFSVLMVKTGGSRAYGNWASKKIKTATGAQLATVGLGALIFVDDYFNCLTVGNAMRPVTDKKNVSRAKLAYLIDATAAPICIIAPISSWAAAVSGSLEIEGENGIISFIKTIPFNLYAILTIIFMITIILLKTDFFKMRRNQRAAAKGDLFAGETDLPAEDMEVKADIKGKVQYMLIPIIILIACCVGAMIYNGYFYDWDNGVIMSSPDPGIKNVIEAFSNCDAGSALAMGSVVALFITMAYYLIIRAISFKDCMSSIAEGFKTMVPAILILAFAWTLGGIMGAKGAGLDDNGAIIADGTLNAKAYIMLNVKADSMALGIIPFVFFAIACLLSFATGTSWGTFGVLMPIAVTVMTNSTTSGLFYLTIAASMAGAVFGDHVSPISDTTIMASSGAQCNHIDHVKTQMPYAMLVAIVSGISFIVAGFSAAALNSNGNSYGLSAVITLAVGIVLMAAVLVTLFFLNKSGKIDKVEDKIFQIFNKKKVKVNDATIISGTDTLIKEDIADEEKEEPVTEDKSVEVEKEDEKTTEE